MRLSLATLAAAGLLALGAAGCGGDSSAETTPVDTTQPQAPAGFLGVVPQYAPGPEDIARMAEGKVGILRLVLPWAVLDPSPKSGDGDFSTIDPAVLEAAKHGIEVVPTIYGTPDWVANYLDGNDCAPNCGPFAPQSDEALKAWKKFDAELVDRYGPDGSIWSDNPEVDKLPIRRWQIWNEQNSPTFYQPKVDPAAYERVLEAGSEAIKERDPGAEIIMGGMFGTPFKGKAPGESSWDYLREIYAIDGAADAFDAVAAHPYAAHEKKIEYQVEKLRAEVERADDDAGLWITEVGASSDEGPSALERGPEGQAKSLTDAFNYFLAKREAFDIEGVTWYSWRDTDDNQCDWCPGSGLFEKDALEPKPAWEAFVAFTGGS
jgi:polysaccharide biosynthesis protein PslG